MKNKVKNKINNKGQLVSYDLLIAIFIFLMIFAFSATLLNNYYITKEENIDFELKKISAINASQKIFFGNDCLEFGLNGGEELSLAKISCASGQNYFDLKEKLGLENYDFYFELRSGEEVLLEKGIRPAKDAFPITRFSTLDGNLVKGVLILYDK